MSSAKQTLDLFNTDDPHHLPVIKSPHHTTNKSSTNQRRTSIVHHYQQQQQQRHHHHHYYHQEQQQQPQNQTNQQRRTSQLRKTSFTTSVLSLAVNDDEGSELSSTRLSISNSLSSVHKQCEEEDHETTNKLLEIGRVAAWAVGFEKMLADDLGLNAFTMFLEKEFSQENIQFWLECEKLKKLSDQDQIRTKIQSIWKTYFQDTDDESCRINIDSRTRHECQQALQQEIYENIFEKAQSQIFQLMKYDSYTRFLKSPVYKECIMCEMEGKPIPYTKQQQATNNSQQNRTASQNDDRSKGIDHLTKLKDDEKKDKKRSPLLPWTKAFIKWKRLSTTPETSKDNFLQLVIDLFSILFNHMNHLRFIVEKSKNPSQSKIMLLFFSEFSSHS